MSRSPLLVHRSLLSCLLIALFSGMAVADDEKPEDADDADSVIPGVARSLGHAWESFEEHFEIASAHGARGQVAWKKLQVEGERSRVLLEIQNGDAMVGTWPQNRYHWNVQQLNYLNVLQGDRQYLNRLDSDLRDLDRDWRMLDEAARMQAQVKGKAAIPLDREGLLRELQRLIDEKQRTYAAAKLAVHDAAEESKQTPTEVLNKAIHQIRSSTADPRTLKAFITEFKAFYGKSKSKGKHPSKKTTRTAVKKKSVEPLAVD